MLAHTVNVYSSIDPIKYIFEKPVLNGRFARWTLLLSEYDIKYVPLKAIKGRVVSDFLAKNTVSEPVVDTTTFPDDGLYHITSTNHISEETWKLFFDGTSNHRGCGIGILLISPDACRTPMSIKIDFEVTNNAAEYEACLQGLRAALALNIKNLQVFGDSSRIITQVSCAWKIRSESLAPYQNCIDKLIK